MGQSEGPGKGALVGHSQGRGHGKGVLTHWGVEGYGCNPEEHTVVAVGRGNLGGIVWAHTEDQKVVGEYQGRTCQRAVAGGTLVNLWVPQASASPQRGGLQAFWGGPWHEVAEAYRVWAQSPGDQVVILGHWDSLHPS